jgi:hypothetical protein
MMQEASLEKVGGALNVAKKESLGRQQRYIEMLPKRKRRDEVTMDQTIATQENRTPVASLKEVGELDVASGSVWGGPAAENLVHDDTERPHVGCCRKSVVQNDRTTAVSLWTIADTW